MAIASSSSTTTGKDAPNQREGMAFSGGAYVQLPEMAISFARGLFFQAWVRPDTLQEGIIAAFGRDDVNIALKSMKDGSLTLEWRGADSKFYRVTKLSMFKAGEWTHLDVILASDGILFYQGGKWCPPDGPYEQPALPVEKSRTDSSIGALYDGRGAFAGAIADVRLWNRSFGLAKDPIPPAPLVFQRDIIRGRASRDLTGDEPGLVGRWTLEGPEGARDASRFGRHGKLVGGAFKAGATSVTIDPPQAKCIDFGAGTAAVKVDDFALDGSGFTWQAQVNVRDLKQNTRLLRASNKRTGDALEVATTGGALTASLVQKAQTVKLASADGVFTANTWRSVALQIGPDGAAALFVDGAIVGAPAAATKLPPDTYEAMFGERLDGQMAEVRLWSRTLSAYEIKDTSARRIHGWAPGLVSCYRMDEEAAVLELINADPSGPRALAKETKVADSGALKLGPTPVVKPQRVAGLSDKVTLPVLPTMGSAGFSVQMWVNLDALDSSQLFAASGAATLYSDRDFGGKSQILTPGRYDIGQLSVGNDQVSSVKVPRGTAVTLYENASFQGKSWRVEKDTALVGADVNDKASSVVVESVQPCLALLSNNGALGVEYPSAKGPQRFELSGVFSARRWAHLTVTVDAEGLVCVYKDGLLIGRQDLESPTDQTLAPWLGSLKGSIAEVRVFSRALSQQEVEVNWRLRVKNGVGLIARWALAEDLAGTPGAATGSVLWREAPSIPLLDGAPPARATVKARCSLLADQTRSGQLPQLCVDLMAFDDAGNPRPLTDISVIVGEKIDIFRSTVAPANMIQTPQNFTVKTGPRGSVRLVMTPRSLLVPIFRVRSAEMSEGEWVLVTPDQVIHQALATLTVNEVMQGRRATASTVAGTTTLAKDGADKLVKLLRGMLGAAASFSFEEQSTAALAFDASEEEQPAGPAHTLSTGALGASIVARPDAPLVRRLGSVAPVAAVVEDDGIASFGLIDDGIQLISNVAKTVATAVMDTVEGAARLGSAIVTSISISVDTVINGLKVAASWVVKTVEEAAAAVADLFAKIGKTLSQVFDYLADLFNWSDFLATADLMLTGLNKSLVSLKTKTTGIFTDIKSSIRGIEDTVLKKLGGSYALPSSVSDAHAEQEKAPPPEPPGPLDYLLSLLPDDLSQTIKDLMNVFAPIDNLLSGALGRLSTLGDGLASEWQNGALKDSLANPSKFLDSDPSDWLELARILVRIVFNAVVMAVDFVGDLAVAVLQTFENLFKLQLNIPVLTAFVEKFVLGGRKMTVGILLCLIPAIPTTLMYKLVTGRKEGPAALVSQGAQSFADSEAEAFPLRDVIMRCVSAVMIIITGVFDGIDALEEGDDDGSVSAKDVIMLIVNGVKSIADGIFLVYDEVTEKTTALQDWKFGMDVAAWVVGVAGLVAEAVKMRAGKTAGKALKVVPDILGAASGGIGVVSGILDVVSSSTDEKKSKGDVWVSSLDLTSGVGEFAAGVAIAVPKTKTQPADGIRAGVIIGGHVVGAVAAIASTCVVIGENA